MHAETNLRNVKNAEILTLARKKCKMCQGKGYFVRIRVSGKSAELCYCAIRRFVKMNPSAQLVDGALKVPAEAPRE